MKIALAHKRLGRTGGTEIDFYRTAKGLRDLGHEIHLFCSEYEVKNLPGTVAHSVPCLPFGRTARLWSFAALAPRVLRGERCDVVVGFGRMLDQDVLRSGGGSHRVFLQKMARAGGPGRRLWQQVSLYHRSVLAIERRQYQPGNYRKILAVSEEVKREIVADYGVPEDKVAVVYNGVDHQRFHPSLRRRLRQQIRRQWGLPDSAPVVLFVGSGFRRKGLDRLLSAWTSARLQGAYLLVVGEDAQRGRYQSRAERDTPGRVVFTGRQNDIENYYAAADLVALPAIQEAFGNVVLEALASGLPVLVSRAVGAAEVLRGDLSEGILAGAEEGVELESKVIRMLELARTPALAEQARKLGEAYSWDSHFKELERHLLEVADRKRREAPS